MLLEGQVAFITGASRGIGRATALCFASHGARLAMNGRDVEALMKVSDEIQQLGRERPLLLPYDVSDVTAVKDAFRSIKSHFGQLDVLVNNAGRLADSLLGMLQPQLVEDTMTVNLHAALYHMQYASRLMTTRRSGSIINVSSIMGIEGETGQTVYSASKAALIGATKSAAKELASTNIRVNAVAPGLIETDLIAGLKEDKLEERLRSIRMKRAGSPEEVAGVIVFLASELSSYVTGQVIGVDGGMVI